MEFTRIYTNWKLSIYITYTLSIDNVFLTIHDQQYQQSSEEVTLLSRQSIMIVVF